MIRLFKKARVGEEWQATIEYFEKTHIVISR
jgi:hypothetical protein